MVALTRGASRENQTPSDGTTLNGDLKQRTKAASHKTIDHDSTDGMQQACTTSSSIGIGAGVQNAAVEKPCASSSAQLTITVLAFMYGAFIVCRQFFSVTQAAIVADPNMSLDNNACANIVVTAGIGFGLSKVITGILVDSMDAMSITYCFMVASAMLVLAFSFCESYTAMVLLGFLNAIPQAGGYPALNKIVYVALPPSQYSTAIAAISVGSRIGASGSYLLLGACLNYLSWRATIRVAPAFILTAMVASMWALRNTKPSPTSTETSTTDTPPAPEAPRPILAKMRWIFSSAQFWQVTMASACLLVSKGFEAVAPLYVKDVLALSPATSTMLVSTIPAGLVASVLFGNRYLEKLSPKRRAEATVALCGLNFLTGCMLAAITWYVETGGPINPSASVLLCGLLFFSLGFSAGYCFYVPQSLFAIDFGGADSATVVGCSELIQAVVGASSLKMAGSISTQYGWRYVWLVIVFVGVCATCCMTAFQRSRMASQPSKLDTKSKKTR